MVLTLLNTASGVPLYLQLMEQVKHAVETGALREGDQLPTIRKMAEEMVMNPNTVVRAYRDLEHEGVLELRHGSGAFIKSAAAGRAALVKKAQAEMKAKVEKLVTQGLNEDELRRAFEGEMRRALEGRTTAARIKEAMGEVLRTTLEKKASAGQELAGGK